MKLILKLAITLVSLVGLSWGQQNNFPAKNTNNNFTGQNIFFGTTYAGLFNNTFYVGPVYVTPQAAVTAACAVGSIRNVEVPPGTATGINLSTLSGCTNVYVTDKRAYIPLYGTWGSGIYTFTSGGGGGGGFPIILGATSIAASSTTTAVTGLTVNGVTLNAAGSTTLFLNQAGGYTTPPGGSSGISGLSANCIPKAATSSTLTGCSSATDNGTSFTIVAENLGVSTTTTEADITASSSGNGAKFFAQSTLGAAGAVQYAMAVPGANNASLIAFGTGNGAGLAGVVGLFDSTLSVFPWATNTTDDIFFNVAVTGGNVAAGTGATAKILHTGAATFLTVNGVSLTTGGSPTLFLNQAGGYTTPAGGSGTITASPKFQLPFYSATGTASTLTGDSAIVTDGAGNLTVNGLTATGTTGVGGGGGAVEGTATTGVASSDLLYALASSHRWTMNNNAAGALTIVGITTPATSGNCAKFASNGIDVVDQGSTCGGTQVYPGAGIANSTGSAWGTSYTTTGSGTVIALATSPVLVTPTLGVASATRLTLTDTVAGFMAFGQGTTPAAVGACAATNVWCTYAPATISTSVFEVLPGAAATGFWFGTASGQTVTDSFVAANGTGNVVLTTSPALITPTLGVASATSINKVTITAPTTSATLTLVTGSTLTLNGAFNTQFTGSANATFTLPGATDTLVGLAATQTLTNKTLTSPTISGGGTINSATVGQTTPAAGSFTALKGTTILTTTNCSSSASPAVCSSAPAGSVVVAAAATTVVVNTTAVTANSQIIVQEDSSLGTKLSVTCNTVGATAPPLITARTAATSFTITTTTPTTNPRCFSYQVVN